MLKSTPIFCTALPIKVSLLLAAPACQDHVSTTWNPQVAGNFGVWSNGKLTSHRKMTEGRGRNGSSSSNQEIALRCEHRLLLKARRRLQLSESVLRHTRVLSGQLSDLTYLCIRTH